MENRILFEVDTAWTFPVIQYTANTSYVEVKKASGIAYILLQLISNSENNSENLVVMLKSLGVPNDIHYIFAGELANMISYGIIRMKSGRDFESDSIDEYIISDFEITDLGRKLFAEGTIPTGNNKTKKIHVYYDVSRKNTQIKVEWKLFKLENSMLDKNCIGDVVLDNSDVEMFINDNMSKYSFRKGERISGFEHEQPEILVYKIDDTVTFSITPETIRIQAKDKERDVFLHKFYTTDVISRIMDAKKKYHFPQFVASEVKEYDYEKLKNVVKLSLPSQFAAITNVKSQLSLGGSCDIKGSECAIGKEESLELMQKCDIPGAACYFENGNLFTIIPGRFFLDVEGYSGKCAINLVAVQQLHESIKQQLLREVFLKCIERTEPFECCDIIKKLTQISKCNDYLEQFSDYMIKKCNGYIERIEVFLKLDKVFSKVDEWSDYAKLNAKSLLEALCEQVSFEEFAAHDILGKELNKILGLHAIDYLSKISKKIVESKDDVIAFEAMEGAGYSTDIVLNVVNVFELYCNQILEGVLISGNSQLSGQCAMVGQTLFELKDITGIENPYQDSAKLDFDNDRFIQVMATFTDSLKKLEKYKVYAMNQYKKIITFQERFVDLKEVVNVEREAFKNPKNINKNYIEQRLKKSRYKDAICDLHVRLQFELNRLFNTENMSTFDLLSGVGISKYLTNEEVDSMHDLRKCRNGFQHPKNKRDVQYSEKIIREWYTTVEKLGGMNNESCSKD